MAKKFSTNTSAFSIAHYILFFLVVGICITVIAWVMIHNNNPHPTNNVSKNVTHIDDATPCAQRVRDVIVRMWLYEPQMVPQKYWGIAENFLNQTITRRTYGICQDVAYVCRPGQIRIDCDPCAVPNARKLAQSIHVADMTKKNCDANINDHATESNNATIE